MLIGNVRPQQMNTEEKMEIKSPPVIPDSVKEQDAVKAELSVHKTQETDVAAIVVPLEHGDNATVIAKGNSTDIRKSEDKEKNPNPLAKDPLVKAFISPSSTTTKLPGPVHHFHHEEEEFLLNDDEDISNSLATGFYFFLALSSGAVIFILFKIYRLRLSRAERKYGVQGDRSNQELTPLPISIEDGHSDDEEQIVFEVQRQNIRIL